MFYRPQALRRLASLPHDVIVPAVVFTERARQLAKRGVPPAEFEERLASNAFDVEVYGPREATRFAPAVHDDEAWRRLARDAMIAGHVREADGDVLWTTDPSDFQDVGLPEDALMAV